MVNLNVRVVTIVWTVISARYSLIEGSPLSIRPSQSIFTLSKLSKYDFNLVTYTKSNRITLDELILPNPALSLNQSAVNDSVPIAAFTPPVASSPKPVDYNDSSNGHSLR